MRNHVLLFVGLLILVTVLSGCRGGGGSGNSGQTPPPSDSDPEGNIRLNQVGFYPGSKKMAVVPGGSANAFSVISADDLSVQFSGMLGDSRQWPYSNENVRLADFSGLETPGSYRVRVEGFEDSPVFEIAAGVYGDLNRAALKAFYYNRSSTALDVQHAGQWARAAGHPDTNVLVHASAASDSTGRPEGASISSPDGWYDAGDYNKYIVNSGISTYTLLAAYEHFGAYYDTLDLNIPESGDSLPDILDEALWNIRWMLTMQDPGDGGVYHKLTTQNFAGFVMPDQATATRYVVQKSTAAALNFAAVMAVASRVFVSFDTELPGFASECRAAAEAAWAWAEANPTVAYVQPNDIHTGQYAISGDTFYDEFAWAAAELYITTQDDNYYNDFLTYQGTAGIPSWGFVDALAWVSLAFHGNNGNLTMAADQLQINTTILSVADNLLDSYAASAYGAAMGVSANDFVWGSNSVALNQGLMLIQAYMINNDPANLEAAQANLDYILGRNATEYSFVTGYGDLTPQDIHHRQSAADGIAEPVPGFVVGGPHSGQQDGCAGYPSNLPAKSYVDNLCSYSTNEVTINWNAPLVYLTGALESISTP